MTGRFLGVFLGEYIDGISIEFRRGIPERLLLKWLNVFLEKTQSYLKNCWGHFLVGSPEDFVEGFLENFVEESLKDFLNEKLDALPENWWQILLSHT